jgi:hypothetical protein
MISSLRVKDGPRFVLVTILIGLIGLSFSNAEIFAYTAPRGIYKVKVAGKPESATQARTYLGIQLLPDKRFVGLIHTVNGNTLSLENVGSHLFLQDPQQKLYVHVLNGIGTGFVVDIQEIRENDILCSENLSPWMSAGTQISIRPHSRLADVFGIANRFGLGSGPGADMADNVVIWDPVAQQEVVYYFHSTRARWERKDVEEDASHAILRFPNGLYIVRRTPGTLWLVLTGDVGSASVLLPVRPGANVLSMPINLSVSLGNLFPTGGSYSLLDGPNANQADLLTFEEPSTGGRRGPFYFLSQPGSQGWREVGVNGSNDAIEPLDLLSTLVLQRRGTAGYIFAEGSLDPGPGTEAPSTPEPGEPPLTGELRPPPLPPSADVVYQLQVCTDLQNWVPQIVEFTTSGDMLTFPLPSGYPRGFYRLRVSINF